MSKLPRRFFIPSTRAGLALLALSLSLGLPVQAQTATAPDLSGYKGEVASAGAAPTHAPLKRVLKAEKLLVGTWRSVDSNTQKAPPGNMFFQPNGNIVIAPDNYRPLFGTWEADLKTFRVTTIGQGDALISYSLSKNHALLTVRYENAQAQVFFRQPTQSPKP
jgi:hypothetical protein